MSTMADSLHKVPGVPPPESLGEYLSLLKSSGCALLITGDTDPETRAAVSRYFFGVPESDLQAIEPTRKRVLVRTEHALTPQQYLPSDVDGKSETTGILDVTEGDRSSVAMDPSFDEKDSFERSQSTELDDVTAAVRQQVEDVLAVPEQPAAGELRIGCDSLRSLEKRFEEEAVETFANSLATIARRNRGMCHLHYPTEDAGDNVPRFNPIVNARLEIATVGNRIYVTWHTPYEDIDNADTPINWFEKTEE